MAGQVRGRVAVPAALTALACLLTSCGTTASTAPGRADVQRLLDARARAQLAGDASAWEATGVGAGGAGREEFTNLSRLPLSRWTYRLEELRAEGNSRARAVTELRFRLDGWDRAPQTTTRVLELARREGRWYVANDRPGPGASPQLWEQGPLEVHRGTGSLVLGAAGADLAPVEVARYADAAVPQVNAAWGRDWRRRVVVVLPASLRAMAALLGAGEREYQGIAAVTTGQITGAGDAPADRILVNPEAYASLGRTGRQFVMTHEATHVATRPHTTPGTPLWLSEGFADWAAQRRGGRPVPEAAPGLARAVREKGAAGAPKELPADADFSFTGDATKLGRAYEGGWLACRMIAERWGAGKLRSFYRAVGEHAGDGSAARQAMRSELGTDEAEFTKRWRAYVIREVGGAARPGS